MRSFQTTMFVIGMLILTTQTFRHVYVKWVEDRTSVLDRFREPVEQDIAKSKSLEELTAMYEKAYGGVKGFERDRSMEDVRIARDVQPGPFREESELRMAIERLEEQRRDFQRLLFYWACGLLSILVGLVVHTRVNPWLGMVSIVVGFAEMAFWTSPLMRSWGPQRQFDELLLTKLILSVISTALLVAVWLLRARALRRTAGGAASPLTA